MNRVSVHLNSTNLVRLLALLDLASTAFAILAAAEAKSEQNEGKGNGTAQSAIPLPFVVTDKRFLPEWVLNSVMDLV